MEALGWVWADRYSDLLAVKLLSVILMTLQTRGLHGAAKQVKKLLILLCATRVTLNTPTLLLIAAIRFLIKLEFGNAGFLVEEKPQTCRKILKAETRTNNKLNPHMLSLGFQSGPHWRKTSGPTYEQSVPYMNNAPITSNTYSQLQGV